MSQTQQNSVVHSNEIKNYFAVALRLITEFAFSSCVYTDKELVSDITKSLPLFYFEILRRQYHDINIRVVAPVVQGKVSSSLNFRQ